MDNLLNDDKFGPFLGNWDWQPKRLKQQYGQLTLSDVTLTLGKEMGMLIRIGNRIGKTHDEVINLLKRLKPF